MKKLLVVLAVMVAIAPLNPSAAQVPPGLFQCPPGHPGIDLVPNLGEYCAIQELILELEETAADTTNDLAFRAYSEAQAAMWENYLLTYGPDLGPGNGLYLTPAWALPQQALDEEWLPGDPRYEALNLDLIPGPGDKTTADAPFRGMFYYPWYPEDWGTCTGGNPSRSRYDPARGCYSQDPVAGQPNPVIFEHVDDMVNAGVEVAISSWYKNNPGSTAQSNRDKRFIDLLNASVGTNLTWALYYEREGFDSGDDPNNFGDPRWDQIRSDLNYAMSLYGTHPNYLRINGKPVVFVFADSSDSCGDGLNPALAGPTEMVERWRRAIQQSSRQESIPAPNIHAVFKVFSGYDSCPADAYPRGSALRPSFSFHQYAPAAPIDQVHNPVSTTLAPGSWGSGSYVISPGFWHYNETTPRDNPPLAPTPISLHGLGGPEDTTRDLVEFRASARSMTASGRSWQLITTYNEFIEGTQVEADTRFGNVFLNAVATDGVEPALQGKTAGAGDIACRGADSNNDGTPDPGVEPPAVGTSACHMRHTSNMVIDELNEVAAPQELVIALGDTQYQDGESENFVESYNPTWGRFKNITRPAIGNHEYNPNTDCVPSDAGVPPSPDPPCEVSEFGFPAPTGSDENSNGIFGDGYFKYFGNGNEFAGNDFTSPGYRRPSVPTGHAEGVYRFSVGNWLFVSMNSNCTPAGGCSGSSPQVARMTEWINAHKAALTVPSCEVLYWHHNRFSDGDHGNDEREDTDTGAQDLQHIFQRAYNLGVEMVLVGHDHDYQRFTLLKQESVTVTYDGTLQNKNMGFYDPEFGVRYVIVGTGGRDTTGVDVTDPGPNLSSGSMATPTPQQDLDPLAWNGTSFGIFDMELRPNDATFTWRADSDDLSSVSGEVNVDTFNTTCHD